MGHPHVFIQTEIVVLAEISEKVVNIKNEANVSSNKTKYIRLHFDIVFYDKSRPEKRWPISPASPLWGYKTNLIPIFTTKQMSSKRT